VWLATLPEPPAAGASFAPFSPDFALAFPGGDIAKYDAETGIPFAIGRLSKRPTVIRPFSVSTILVGAGDGSVALFDCRETQAAPTRTIECGYCLTDIALWPNGSAIVGLATVGGLVTIFDLRTWTAAWVDKSPPVEQMLPMALDAPALAYLAMNAQCVEIVTEPRIKPVPRIRAARLYREAAPFRLALPYLGGAVVVDDVSASFVHASEAGPLVRLCDGGVRALAMRAAGADSEILGEEEDAEALFSVHQHAGVVTCGAIVRDTVITCDDMGFMHRWRLDPEVVVRKSGSLPARSEPGVT
jgi:hypothetical protein